MQNALLVLIGATILGKVDLVKNFLKDGRSPECTDQVKIKAMEISVFSKKKNDKILMQNGMTPLLWAVKCKNSEMIEMYVAKGANFLVKDEIGDDVLITAVKSTEWDEESVIKFHVVYKEYIDIHHKNKVLYTFFLNLSLFFKGEGMEIRSKMKSFCLHLQYWVVPTL